MESTRQNKIARLIQKDLSRMFLSYTRTLHGVLVSVSEVRVSPDLSIAHVFLSIFPQSRQAEVMDYVNTHHSKIRGEMGNLERHQLRIIPELEFHLDQTLDKMERIEQLLNS
mgnify:CR=1 FL=1